MVTALDDLVADMAHLLNAPCTLEDPDFRLIGFSDQGSADDIDQVRRRSILERGSGAEVVEWFHAQGIRDSEGPIRTPDDETLGVVGRLCVPARHRGRVHGYFWLLDPDYRIAESLWPEAVCIAEKAAALLNLVQQRQEHRDALFRELMEGRVPAARQSALELAAAGGLDVYEPVACVLVRRPDLPQQLASRPSRPGVVWVRTHPNVCAALVRGSSVPTSRDISGVLTDLGLGHRLISLDPATRIGIGPTVSGLDRLTTAHAGAMVALRVASAGSSEVVDWQELGPLALLGIAPDDDLAWVIVPEPIRTFLTEASPELVETARFFLDMAGSVARTAERLAVHRQTVYHRLAHIERQTGCDLADGEDRLRLHLALRLWPYLLPRPSRSEIRQTDVPRLRGHFAPGLSKGHGAVV